MYKYVYLQKSIVPDFQVDDVPVDGYDEESNTIFQVQGCYFHRYVHTRYMYCNAGKIFDLSCYLCILAAI